MVTVLARGELHAPLIFQPGTLRSFQFSTENGVRTVGLISVPLWRMLPASEPTLAASATTVIPAPVLTLTSRCFWACLDCGHFGGSINPGKLRQFIINEYNDDTREKWELTGTRMSRFATTPTECAPGEAADMYPPCVHSVVLHSFVKILPHAEASINQVAAQNRAVFRRRRKMA